MATKRTKQPESAAGGKRSRGGKRGNNEGTISKRSDGRWEARISLGSGTRKTFYGKTREEVADKLAAALSDKQKGLPINTKRQTVKQFLETWLAESVKPNLRPKTYRVYEQCVRLYLVPDLGRHQLDKLQPHHVQAALNRLRDAGRSPRTVDCARAVLRRALNQALRWGYVARNVATLVDPPKQTRGGRRYLTPHDARAFLDAIQGQRLEALYTVALSVGLRQGEALGLRWEDVDLDAGVLHVRHALQRIDGTLQLVEPKSAAGRRTIALPDVASAALKRHRARQLEDRLAAGPDWHEQGYVFTAQTGNPLDARNVVRQFHRLREAAGLPWLRFHDLRHGFGSLLAAQGVHPRVAMELLGHSQISLTMQVYTHVAPELAKEAAAKIDAALG